MGVPVLFMLLLHIYVDLHGPHLNAFDVSLITTAILTVTGLLFFLRSNDK